MNLLSEWPDRESLLKNDSQDITLRKVNGHIHTPYSFSAFESVAQAVQLAKNENIDILGINDFYVADGYDEFYRQCVDNKIFPLFNIEFISLIKDFQSTGVRVNDPNNPGRTYFSGKGLAYPFKLSEHYQKMLNGVKQESMRQVGQMIALMNKLLLEQKVDFRLSLELVKSRYAKDLVRERHIAKALRIAIAEHCQNEQKQREIYTKLFDKQAPKADLTNEAALENEIRSRLLKAGGAAFVPEDSQAFLDMETVRDIILDAKGIPCYPVLLDFKDGQFTDFESDKVKMLEFLINKNVFCIELIPGRNQFAILKDFVQFFEDQGFVVLFGTEHNTPAMQALTVSCSDQSLDSELQRIGYEGACIVAAHQYLTAQGQSAYVDSSGMADRSKRQDYVRLGHSVLNKFFKS